MSHPTQLISEIRVVIERDYPPDLYSYTIEKAIPGTRMHPDILVFDGQGKMQCAVEIGYTRPEKLTAYRVVHNIPDVRWYDKQGVLHADVQEKVIKASIRFKNPTHLFSVYVVEDCVPCNDDMCVCSDDEQSEPKEDALSEELISKMDAEMEDRCQYVQTTIITDWIHVWFVSFCDKCGKSWFTDEEDADLLFFGLQESSPTEFARVFGGMKLKVDWSKIVELIKEDLSLAIQYDEGIIINPEHRRLIQREIDFVRGEVEQ